MPASFDTGEKLGEVYVEVTARADKLDKELRDLRGKVEKSTTSLGTVFGSFFSKALAAAGAFIGLQNLINFSKEAIKLAKEQAKAEAQVKQAIDQTGRAAGLSADQLFKEAAALQAIAGVGDEISLQNITKQLLTFTNVVGDNFLRAQRAILDLNATINQGAVSGLTSQSIQLGKALEDPIRGISALSRNGITFTEQQKELIKTLVESGNLFKAQAIILDEIEAKYGGQAQALADASAGTLQLSAAFGDLLERIGKRFLPFIESSSRFLSGFFASMASDEPKTLAQEIEELSKNARDQVLSFEKLTRQYYNLRSESEKTTAQEKLYLQTINELQKKYPNYLKSIDLEKDKVEKVAGAFRSAKEALQKYLEVQIKEAIISKKRDELVKIGEAQYNLEKRRQELSEKALAKVSKLKPLKGDEVITVEVQTRVVSKGDDAALEDQKIFQQIEDQYRGQKNELQDEITSIMAEVSNILAIAPEAPRDDKKIKLNFKVEPLFDVELRGLDKNVENTIQSYINPTSAQVDVFEKLRFDASGYYKFRLKQIDDEGAALRKGGAHSLNVEEFVTRSKMALHEAYFTWLQGQREENLTREQEAYQKIAEAQNENFDFVTAWYDSLVSGFEGAFEDIKVSADSANSVLEKGFVSLANAFIGQVKRMVAEWLAFKVLTAGLGLLGIPLPLPLPTPGAASGGTFSGTATGVKRLASGGSFIVPEGYQSDSYPLMVQSGEKVTVTPAGGVAQQERMLSQIREALGDLGAIMINNRNSFQFQANLEGFLSGQDIRMSYDRTRRVEKRMR